MNSPSIKYLKNRLALPAALVLAAAIALLAGGCTGQSEGTSGSSSHDHGHMAGGAISLQMHTTPSVEPGVNLSLREKHVDNMDTFSADKVVLLLEPFGVPAAEAFDFKISQYSLMDHLSSQGFDVWALDFRGFGASDRPAAYNQPMMASAPQLRAADAVKDVEAAINYICEKRGIDKVNLVGWSWGGVVASQYASAATDKVEKLVVYGGMYAFKLPAMTKTLEDEGKPGVMKKLPAYQMADPLTTTVEHWKMQAKDQAKYTDEARDEMVRIFLAADATSGSRSPATIRRAMGPMVDLYEIWSGRPIFDAGKIKAPTLLIRGSLDTFSNDPGFMDALSGAQSKKYVELPDATHWALYESDAAPKLMEEITSFLNEK